MDVILPACALRQIRFALGTRAAQRHLAALAAPLSFVPAAHAAPLLLVWPKSAASAVGVVRILCLSDNEVAFDAHAITMARRAARDNVAANSPTQAGKWRAEGRGKRLDVGEGLHVGAEGLEGGAVRAQVPSHKVAVNYNLGEQADENLLPPVVWLPGVLEPEQVVAYVVV